MLSRVQPIQKSQIYISKKQKEPDHLFLLIEKNKNKQMTCSATMDEDLKNQIKKQIIQKRVDSIMKNSNSKVKVSAPEPFVKKKWISPLAQLHENQSFNAYTEKITYQITVNQENKERIQNVVKVLDLNKKLKYFGEYLQVAYESNQKMQITKQIQIDSKVKYLTKKFHELQKQVKPNLCIMNFPVHEKMTFINYLEPDQCYQDIIRKNDQELVRLLIQTLKINDKFTITSLIKFYDIFVWQTADKKQQMQFVAKLLMKELKEQSIVQIGKVIDMVCSKIHIQQFNKTLDNFHEVMKKLIFGDDYQNSGRREYYLTRKALMESLKGNEECISIFINIFYAS